MQYVVVLEQGEGNWSAYVPDAPGCVTTGATREDVEQNIREALALWLEVSAEHSQTLPEPGTWTTVVDVEIPAGARFAPRAERAGAHGA
jgi:predicted RNase H-like HicB family nuclease